MKIAVALTLAAGVLSAPAPLRIGGSAGVGGHAGASVGGHAGVGSTLGGGIFVRRDEESDLETRDPLRFGGSAGVGGHASAGVSAGLGAGIGIREAEHAAALVARQLGSFFPSSSSSSEGGSSGSGSSGGGFDLGSLFGGSSSDSGSSGSSTSSIPSSTASGSASASATGSASSSASGSSDGGFDLGSLFGGSGSSFGSGSSDSSDSGSSSSSSGGFGSLFGGSSTSNDVTDNSGCKALTFIFARGTTEMGNMGSVVGPKVGSELDSLTGGKVAIQGVDYPADAAGNAQLGASGGPKMAELVNTAKENCPDTKVVLGGYSQGAMVVHNAAGKLSSGDVVGAVTFGDPFKTQKPDNIEQFKTWCATGDPVCANGANVMAHLTYGDDAAEAAKFLVNAAGL
ncbi:cutinase-domain-containing protein [Aspergillus oleicola]